MIAWGCSARTPTEKALGSITAAVSMPVSTWFLCGHNGLYTSLTVIIAVLVLWCHRENIQRLLRGQERKFHWHTGPEK